MAHIQVTHIFRFDSLVKALAVIRREADDDLTKAGTEKAIRAMLVEEGASAFVDWSTADEDRDWAEEHARRWWGSDFGSA
jgi:hypothetical protein